MSLTDALRTHEQPPRVDSGPRRTAAESAPRWSRAVLQGRALKPPQPRDEHLLRTRLFGHVAGECADRLSDDLEGRRRVRRLQGTIPWPAEPSGRRGLERIRRRR